VTKKPWMIGESDRELPMRLERAMDAIQETSITGIGNRALLDLPLTALFCSSRCPGSAILLAMDRAQRWSSLGTAVVSGFHSPVERECLNILLAGKSPLIVCLARSLEKYRLPTAWRSAVAADRLLVLSPFRNQVRVTSALAERRNLFVAGLAAEIDVIYSEPGSKTEKLIDQATIKKLICA